VALGKPLAVCPQNCGKVRELRHRPSKGFVDGDLLGRVGNVIVAADHVRDAHERIVDGDHVVIDRHTGRHTAGTSHQHRIAHGFRSEHHVATNNVVEAERVVFDSQANREMLAGGEVLFDLTGREIAAAARVDLRAMFRGGLGTLRLELLRSAEAAVRLAFGQQALGMLGVDRQPLRLTIRPMVAGVGFVVGAGPPVPFKAEPVQVFDELGFVARFGAIEVGVLNAQQEQASGAARKQPVVKGRTRVTDVEQTCGRRSKPYTGNGVGHGNKHDRR